MAISWKFQSRRRGHRATDVSTVSPAVTLMKADKVDVGLLVGCRVPTSQNRDMRADAGH